MDKLALLAAMLFTFGHSCGQCYEDRHNTSWNESWVSCQVDLNPNPQRGLSHWILYDFGNTYRIGQTHMWNLNVPEWLDNGFRDFYVDYSVDGLKWKQLGQFTLEKADGTSTYEGTDLTSFGGDTARFVVLTAIDNWGGECHGFAEIQFEVLELVHQLHTYADTKCFEVSVYPNPHQESFNLSIRPACHGKITYALYDHTGKAVLQGRFADNDAAFVKTIQTGSMAPGLYHLVIVQGHAVERYPVMKM